ncbi:MAG: hypothetical protein GY851_04770 [bacterium]|nr:hypothetical protein [bacterium]
MLLVALNVSYSRMPMNRSLKELAKIVKEAIKSEAPEGPTGNLKKSITHKVQENYAVIGPDHQQFAEGEKGYHAHLVEFGTVARYSKSGGFRGVMPPNPFMRRAWTRSVGPAYAAIRRSLSDAIEREARCG